MSSVTKKAVRSLMVFVTSLTALAIQPAHASTFYCSYTGHGDVVHVSLLDAPNGAAILDFFESGLADINGVANNDNYYTTQGIEIINASTGGVEAWYIQGLSGQRAAVDVQSGSSTRYGAEAPVGPQGGFGWTTVHDPGALNPGKYYVVSFSFGGGTVSTTVRFNAYGVSSSGCTNLNPVTQKFKFDQTDFQAAGANIMFGGQVYAPGVGAGSNLSMSFNAPFKFFAGYANTGRGYKPVINNASRLDYTTPTKTGSVVWGFSTPLVSTNGTYSFKLKYDLAPFQWVNIDGWSLDLPRL